MSSKYPHAPNWMNSRLFYKLSILFCRWFLLPMVDLRMVYDSEEGEYIIPYKSILYKRLQLFGCEMYFRKIMGCYYKDRVPSKYFQRWLPVQEDGYLWRKTEMPDVV